jgi:LPXTG-site transpeptidase (sortase) family protein
VYRLKLRHVNNLLFIATVCVLLYVITAPVLPVAQFWLERHTSARLHTLSAQLELPAASVHAAPKDDRIVIPAMLLDETVHEGRDLRALHDGGTWRRPNTSTPDRGGNTVIVAHRFTYSNPRGTFYFLDKLHTGDRIGIFWRGKRYAYTVRTIKNVPSTDTSIEAPTKNAQLTLYTCTPLWLPKERLVVIAQEDRP